MLLVSVCVIVISLPQPSELTEFPFMILITTVDTLIILLRLSYIAHEQSFFFSSITRMRKV